MSPDQLAILTEVFSNRLLDAMREKAGASYSPSVRLDWPTDVDSGGSITGLAQLQPKDVPVFFAEADRIARELTETPPTASELARATEPLRNYYERISSGNYFYLLELEGSTQDPRRMRALRGLLNDYSQTTPEAMLGLAREYFGQEIMGSVFGAATMLSSLGMAIGPLAGGWIFDTYGGYAWMFIGSLAVGLGAAAIALAFPPLPRRQLQAA